MEDFIAPIIVAIVVAVVQGAWNKLSNGWLKTALRAVVVGVEKASREGPTTQAKLVKRRIQQEAERTGAQKRLHDLVKQIEAEKETT